MNTYFTIAIALVALISACVHIWAEYAEQLSQIYLFKPLTMILILVVAIMAPLPISLFYKAAIIIALVLSLFGDIFLMLPGKPLLTGLVFFLMAHILYIYAFSSQVSWLRVPSPLLFLLLLIGGLLYWLLAPYLDEMSIPVAVYGAVILLMAWRGLEMWWHIGETWSVLAAVGAVLFVCSDALLALDHFRRPFKYAHGIVLGSYYVAQLLIALSTRTML